MLRVMLSRPAPISNAGRRALSALAVLDVMTISWMLAAGEWFDNTSRLTSVVTLGGHHEFVLWLAAGGLGMLLATAMLTSGFVAASPIMRGAVVVACGASAIAVGGMVSLAALVAGAVVLAALLGRAFVR